MFREAEKGYKERNDRLKFHLPKKATAPMSNESAELEATNTNTGYYQSLIKIVRWMVSMLSSCLALPREEHRQQLLHMFF